jgi:thioredoxin 1
MAGHVQELTSTTFDEAVAGAGLPVVVDLWAEWCGPCHALAPVLDEIAAENAGALRVFKLDVEAHPYVANRFGVMSFPTLLIFEDGRLVRRVVGARGKQHLLAELSDLLEPESAPGR